MRATPPEVIQQVAPMAAATTTSVLDDLQEEINKLCAEAPGVRVATATNHRPPDGTSSCRPSAAERARFRELIGKVGSGEHTSTGLNREEARTAMDLMLQGQVSEAQLGAFLIAHRIRRPLPLELAGMLDSYRCHGPVLRTPGNGP
jgi:hypothetical protein